MTISKESTNINFNKYKKKELIQFCKDNNIDYKKSYKKNKLIEVYYRIAKSTYTTRNR